MSKLSTVLKALMHDVGITVTELARQTGVGQPVIHRMASGETDNPKVGSLSPIAKFFGINISMLVGDEPLSPTRFAGSYNPYYRSWSQLPLLNWEQCVAWPEKHLPAEICSTISTESNVTDKAFAVRMEDHTMEPQYPKDTLMVFEPSIAASDKDIIAIHVEGQNKIQVKQLMLDGKDVYLKPLNSDFEINRVDKPYRILGVLVQSLTEYYQEKLRKEVEPEEASPVKKKKFSKEEIL
ncbi:MAG: peptidase S24-like domain protein [Gammaproteobacteria bacterium]|jgi:SOS-response transcriptional repressor LexA|nr:peptidase S24-like domain protein [Gammaproteobacteria bacterium]